NRHEPKDHSMIRNRIHLIGASFLTIAILGITTAQEVEKPAKKKGNDTTTKEKPAAPEAAKGPTAKVEKGPLKIEVGFKGVFESVEMSEVMVKSEVWKELVVAKAVEPGTRVKKGDVLVTFDAEKIDKAIREMEMDQKLTEIAMKMAEIELP